MKAGMIGAGTLLCLVATGCAGGPDDAAASTAQAVGNPVMTIGGSEMREAAELYVAMNVPDVDGPSGVVRVKIREISGLRCERYSVGEDDPLGGGTVQHKCTVEANLSQQALGAIFTKLSTREVEAGPMLDKNVKAVGSLFLTKDRTGNYALVKYKACELVNPRDRAAAQRCLDFWAKNVFPEARGPNVAGVSDSLDARARLERVLTNNTGSMTDLPGDWREALRQSGFVGALVQETSDGHLAYFVMTTGRYVVPRELSEANLGSVGESGIKTEHLADWSLGLTRVKTALEAYVY